MKLLEQMAAGLGLPKVTIQVLARKANHAYKVYTIPKRSGGSREIHHPSKELKALQRWLLQNVINYWPVHGAAAAYRPNLSIAHNAKRHAGSNYLLRMDLQNFFPSITSEDVKTYLTQSDFSKLEKWQSVDFDLFTALVCRNGQLTIGAPTSPALSNALCADLDHELEAVAHARDTIYTRYADDLFFSTVRADVLRVFPDLVKEILKSLGCPAGLAINDSKTRHSSKKGRRQITGLVLGSDGVVGVGRKRKRYIRSLIHSFDTLAPTERQRLAGLIAFTRSVEPDFINALIIKFGSNRIVQAQRMEYES